MQAGRSYMGFVLVIAACGGADRPPGQRGAEDRGASPSLAVPGALEAPPTPLRSVRPATLVERAAPTPPPPIAGGTLTILRDDRTAIASDPDHDAVWVSDLTGAVATRPVLLTRGDEPGRSVEGRDGRVYVALRRGGAVVALDAARAAVTARWAVCAAPRGVAWDGATASLYVACAGGELVRVSDRGAVLRAWQLGPDLRDVIATREGVFVTRFREATVLQVRDDGSVVDVRPPEAVYQPDRSARYAAVAWRTVDADGSLVMLHQSTPDAVPLVVTRTQAYYGDATSALSIARLPTIARLSVLSTRGVASPVWSGGLPMLEAGFAVDVAVRIDAQGGDVIAVASPGWAFGQGPAQVNVLSLRPTLSVTAAAAYARATMRVGDGQAVALAWTRRGALVVQTRAPGALMIADDPQVDRVRSITFAPEGERTSISVGDTGHDLFHATTTAGLACASCHPEGGDDGRVWAFGGIGLRRTPSLRGGVSRAAPYHWDGDVPDMRALVDEVFTRRMGGPALTDYASDRLTRWLDSVPQVPRSAPADVDAVARGEALYRASDVGCADCHDANAPASTASVGVGTGGNFQVPALEGLWLRAPFLHDGRARTLRARFTDPSCGGDAHGRTSHLTGGQIDDLVAFLASM